MKGKDKVSCLLLYVLRAKFFYQKYLLRTGCASLQESLSEEEKEYLLEFTDEIKEDVLEILMMKNKKGRAFSGSTFFLVLYSI